MLSYQHEFHAGNHADVLKHMALALVIGALQRKPAPIRVLDVNAGSGLYDLGSRQARQNAEHEAGIARVLATASPPAALSTYLAAVRACNGAGALRRYPGSPWIARRLLRPDDQLELMELHPHAAGELRRHFGRDRQVHIHQRDCFEGLPAVIPPTERRGVVLIDPSYEVKEDFRRVVALLQACHGRWPGGTYLVWHPLIRDRDAQRFAGVVAGSGIRRIYRLMLQVQRDDFPGMRGSGLLIVNLPFGLAEVFADVMQWLWRALATAQQGEWRAHWLVPE